MKYYILGGLFLLCSWCTAQNDTINPIVVAEEMPRFPGCEIVPDLQNKTKCAEQELLRYIYEYIVYPDSAIANDIEGSVVVQFVVTKEGKVAQAKTLKDIGYGCGEEAVRVINTMNEQNVQWIPGKQSGEPVDVYFNLPIRFKLEEPVPTVPYILMDKDTVWTSYDQLPSYKGGEEALQAYIDENLKYPASGLDSCEVGAIACEILIRKNGQAIVMSMYNYSGLNDDFEYEAIRLAARTSDHWNCAQLEGKDVAVLYPLRFTFKPDSESCAKKVKDFETASVLGDEGVAFYNEGKKEEALAKWAEAIAQFPQSVEVRYWRGQAYIDSSEFEAACEDLTAVKAVLGSSGYDNLLPIICK